MAGCYAMIRRLADDITYATPDAMSLRHIAQTYAT